MKRLILLWVLLAFIHLISNAQIDCNNQLIRIQNYYDDGYYPESLKLIDEMEANRAKSNPCLTREFYELKVKVLLAMNEQDVLIESAMGKMIAKDPTYNNFTASNYSQGFYNHFIAYKVYPNIQIGLGTTLASMRLVTKKTLDKVYHEADHVGKPVHGRFFSTGITAYSSFYFSKYLAGKLEVTQNFPSQTEYKYLIDSRYFTEMNERILSRTYSAILSAKPGMLAKNFKTSNTINNFSLDLGYLIFNLYQSNTRYELIKADDNQVQTILYSNEVNTKPYREGITYNALIGLTYEPQQFIENQRLKISAAIRYVIGLSAFNKKDNRLDNQISTQLYYYAEDQLRMNMIQFQLQVGYNVNYYNKKIR